MHTTFEVLEKIEKATGKAKLTILKNNTHEPALRVLLDAALNYRRRFYIKKFDIAPTRVVLDEESGLRFSEFVDTIHLLEKREISGSAAIACVETFLAKCSPIEQKWYARVIRKDLRSNFGVDAAVDAGFKIPVFDVQLAKPGQECKKLDEMIASGAWLSRKVDGYRCVALITNGVVELLTRTGLTFENFPEIEASLAERFAGQSIVLDGEIMSDDFNAMQQTAFASTRGTTVGDVAYHLFDVIDHAEWTSDKFTTKYSVRLQQLSNLFDSPMPANIRLLKHEAVSSRQQIDDLTIQYIHEGYEGLMVKPNIPYYRGKRSNKMLKFKIRTSMDCEVLGVYEGEGRNEGRMGGITVMQENGVTCKVGSGFNDAQREQFWADPSKIIGRITEVEYAVLSNEDKRMIHCTFQRFRDLGPKLGKI